MTRWQQPGVQHEVVWQPQQLAGAVHDPDPSSSVVVVAVVFEVAVVVVDVAFEAFVVDAWVVSAVVAVAVALVQVVSDGGPVFCFASGHVCSSHPHRQSPPGSESVKILRVVS